VSRLCSAGNALGRTALNPTKSVNIRILEAVREERPALPAMPRPQARPLGNGAIQRTAARALADRHAVKLADIRAAIETLLGQRVSYASVEWCVRMGVKAKEPWVERVRPGWYALRSHR
jgi:hypothetical protein